MGRLPTPPERRSILPEELEDFDAVNSRQATLWQNAPSNSNAYFGALLNAPPIAASFASMGRVMRMGQVRGTYSDADRELVDMVLSADFGYRAILALHIPDAIAVGVRLEAIEAIWEGREEDLTPDEQFLAAHIRAVVAGNVTDAQFAALTQRLGPRGAVEYTAFIAFLLATFRLWMGLGVPEPSVEEIDEMLRGYREGTAPQLDAAARIG